MSQHWDQSAFEGSGRPPAGSQLVDTRLMDKDARRSFKAVPRGEDIADVVQEESEFDRNNRLAHEGKIGTNRSGATAEAVQRANEEEDLKKKMLAARRAAANSIVTGGFPSLEGAANTVTSSIFIDDSMNLGNLQENKIVFNKEEGTFSYVPHPGAEPQMLDSIQVNELFENSSDAQKGAIGITQEEAIMNTKDMVMSKDFSEYAQEQIEAGKPIELDKVPPQLAREITGKMNPTDKEWRKAGVDPDNPDAAIFKQANENYRADRMPDNINDTAQVTADIHLAREIDNAMDIVPDMSINAPAVATPSPTQF